MAELLPQLKEAGTDTVVRLTEAFPSEGPVLSIYVDLNPTDFGTIPAKRSALNAALDEAEKSVEGLEGDQKQDLRERLVHLRTFLDDDEHWSKGAAGLAVFCSGSRFEVVKLPVPIESAVSLGDSPVVQPLSELVDRDTYCVVLVNRQVARFFTGTPQSLMEEGEITDSVHGQHKQGGWSQSRYERGIEEEVKDHLKSVSETLLRMLKGKRLQNLVVACAPELWPDLEATMSGELTQRLIGRIEVDVQNASVDDVAKSLDELAAVADNEREKQLLDQLHAELGNGGRAVKGLSAVLGALNEARVETLLVGPGFEATGVSCPACGWLAKQGSECPVDGTVLDKDVDLLEKVGRRVLDTSATLRRVIYNNDLHAHEEIAALTRF